jgi:vitamin B12 transporter
VNGNQLLYNFNPSWLIRIGSGFRVKVLGSISTAYITPSLFQLHTIWGGNPNLKAEEDFNAEYGATFYIKNKIEFTAVNYYRTETNSIVYSPSFQYVNTNQNRYVHGVTLNMAYKLLKNLRFTADYAYTHTNLPNTFYRIPQHKAGAAIAWQPHPSSSLCMQYQFTGERTEFASPDEILLDSYSLVDISVSQKFLKNKFQAFAVVANLFDEDFVAVYGYTTRGRNFSVGLKYSL